jgi:hypothetical protein
MSHKFLVPILAAVFVVAPAVLPSVLVSAMPPGLSGAAQATKNLNSSRSNVNRTAKTRSPATTPKADDNVDRMGGGGGARGAGAFMGVGGGTSLGGGNVDRMGGGGGANTGGGNVNRMGGGGGTSTK